MMKRQPKNADQQFKLNDLQNKLANSVARWQYDEAVNEAKSLKEKLAATKVRQDVSVIVNGHRYKVL